MEEAIKNIGTQFNFEPVIENAEKFKGSDSFVVCGMGGSHLSAGLMKIYNPTLNIYIHRDYGLPILSEKRFKDSLYIACSYSGNTEEVLDFAQKAIDAKLNLAIVAIGGALIELAKKHKVPYIQLPNTNIQPRSAVGFSIIALAKLMEGDEAVSDLHALGTKFNSLKFEGKGKELADTLKGKVPVIYASRFNVSIAYNWKIKFNETGKIPAFYNILPELNHNEMTGFDVIPATKALSDNFYFIILSDSSDNPKIMRRIEVLKKIYEDRGLPVQVIDISGATPFERIFNSLTLADWTSLYISRMYGTEAERVPMVEEFKRLIA